MLKLCICGVQIPLKASLCKECLTIYGTEREKWPEWLLFLVRDTEKELKRDSRHRELEVFEEYKYIDPDLTQAAIKKPAKAPPEYTQGAKSRKNNLKAAGADPDQNFDDFIENNYH